MNPNSGSEQDLPTIAPLPTAAQGDKQATLGFEALTFWQAIGWMAIGVAVFHAAYWWRAAPVLMALYLLALWELSRASTIRWAFRGGFVLGYAVFAPQLGFFWTLFGPTALVLWAILAAWVGLFVALARACRGAFRPSVAAALAPVLWTATEYFRSELYYLRFSWMNAGYAHAEHIPGVVMRTLGMYGMAFVLVAVVAGFSLLQRRHRWPATVSVLLAIGTLANWNSREQESGSVQSVKLAGVQLEYPSDREALDALNLLIRQFPETQLFVLSEYTFDGPVPPSIREWCRSNHRHLVVGAKEPVNTTNYYNTAFVIDPEGNTVFKQVKCVPIQFFADGLPAEKQQVWDSPWGRLGFCVCYDLSYTRVTDELIRKGAQAIIVPTMDAEHWGAYQHALHTRVAPVRAAEYGVPIFRLASSGISQSVTANGVVTATAPFPGQGETLVGTLELPQRGTLPLDRWLGPLSVVITSALIIWMLFQQLRLRFRPASRP